MKFLDYNGVAKLWQKIKFELSKKGRVDKLAAANSSIAISGTEMEPTIAISRSQDEGNALELKADGLYVPQTIYPVYNIKELASDDNYLTSYQLTKDGQTIGVPINIPKGMEILNGFIDIKSEAGTWGQAGVYLHLVLANVPKSDVYILVDSLINHISSGSKRKDAIQIAVFADGTVSASILRGSITKDKFSQEVQNSLESADSALQPADITTGTEEGTIEVAGEDVPVAGLGSAAFASVEEFDEAGAAKHLADRLANVATTGDYNDLSNKPMIPTNLSDFTNDVGYLTSFIETDPTVPSWAKEPTKPRYTANEVGALPDTTKYVKSFNGQSGNVKYKAPVTSVNGQTGEVLLSIPLPQVQSDWNATSGMGEILNKPTKISDFDNDMGYLTSHQDISDKASIESPKFTGVPLAPTAEFGTSNSQIATTAFVQTALSSAASGLLKRKVVINLPTEDIDTNTIYMIEKFSDNSYNEFMYIDEEWKLVGDTGIYFMLDSVPLPDSDNFVTSGVVYAALEEIKKMMKGDN